MINARVIDKDKIENNMDTIREHIYLAALLHDIGKFYQRADTEAYLQASI